jgi:hypothetical protein
MYAPARVIDARVKVTQVRLQPVPTYRVRSMSGDYLGVIEHRPRTSNDAT